MCHVLSSSTNNFADALTLSRMSSLSGRMNIARVWILYWIQENKKAAYFLRSKLFTYDIIKNSTAISIKHRILETFNIKTKINSDSLYSFKNSLFSPLLPDVCVNYSPRQLRFKDYDDPLWYLQTLLQTLKWNKRLNNNTNKFKSQKAPFYNNNTTEYIENELFQPR
jgi:hypothetical protein